ncbi:transcobalamin-1-like [Triplophysa rosa]|uniref:transcobalamin-1-like n=1 Tax=Triplophysa rosa TaxID=992332 RepID=UPI002545F737|nr:transcobalamin-1-like [Triplophysa rosa]
MACSNDITMTVMNTLIQKPHESKYCTSVVEGATLFAALNKIQDSDKKFSFTYTVDKNLGLFLESVNGLYGSKEDHTFWELLSDEEPLNTGIGCYQLKEKDQIILKLKKW